MKPVLTHVFLLVVLASSISTVALAAPFDDEKMSPACPPAAASASHGAQAKSRPEKKLKKEKQKMQKEMEQKNKEEDKYPGFGIYG
jgi:ribosomal protein L12E/L44/L45/RPP1/RPP2